MQKVIQHDGDAVLNVCGCGKVHFSYGPITLHFDREGFVAFARDVSRLADSFRELSDGLKPGLTSARNNTACH